MSVNSTARHRAVPGFANIGWMGYPADQTGRDARVLHILDQAFEAGIRRAVPYCGGNMRYWLFKSEPGEWSWNDQVAAGEDGTEWDGVRNYQARNHMRDMAVGDRGFFYHSQSEKAVVGIVEVCAGIHPDSTTDDPRWECVDVKAVGPMPTPVTLANCKADPRLAGMVLVNNSRLSVQPVAEDEWRAVCELGGLPTGD